MYHALGPLFPQDAGDPKFAQIYIMDPQAQVSHRCEIFEDLDASLLSDLHEWMLTNNSFAQTLQSIGQRVKENPTTEVAIIIKESNGFDRRRYNAPVVEEVAVLLPGDGECGQRDIIIQMKEGGVRRISSLHPSYDPLHYVLMFPYGDEGWAIGIHHTSITLNQSLNSMVTVMEFYSFRLMLRRDSYIHSFGKLFQQYIVDQYAKMEEQRLMFIRYNQTQLRADLYQGLQNAVSSGDANPRTLGKRIVLPSSFEGSPRQMQQLYQDAMAIIRRHGKPDFFITFTCNPDWPEIRNNLLPGQQAIDRPDLVTRIFNLKLKELLDDLFKKSVFGVVVGDVWTIEFQKRGLPHGHILIVTGELDKPRNADDYDV